jgi:AraC-like DNA-binding protein
MRRQQSANLSATKTPLGSLNPGREPIIVVGSAAVAALIAQRGLGEVLVFSSLEELDSWRERNPDDETFGPDVDGALNEIGCSLATLPIRLRDQLEAIARGTKVPPMLELEQAWPSRRSFYRAWKDAVHEPPSAFLRRARLRHAERLIAIGRSKKEAAHLAGFSSPEQLRRQRKK